MNNDLMIYLGSNLKKSDVETHYGTPQAWLTIGHIRWSPVSETVRGWAVSGHDLEILWSVDKLIRLDSLVITLH